jgi:predicted RND superfamily exporter protein
VSTALAAFLYRFRRVLCTFIVIGAVALAPRANITRIDNDLTAWFSRDDPVYREYQHFQDEFGGTRTLIVAVVAPGRDRLFSQDGLAFLDEATHRIEQVRFVDRVASLATATVVDSAPAARNAGEGDNDVVLDVRRLIDDLKTRPPAAVGARAVADDLLRGDLVSEDGTVTSIVVFFDERRIDEVRGAVIDEIRQIVAATMPRDFRAYYNGSLEISETYNRITLANQTKFTPPLMVLTLGTIFLMFRSWRRTLLTGVAVMVSVLWTLGLYSLCGFTYNVLSSMIMPLVTVLAIADDVHIIQHYDEERRTQSAEVAFKSTVTHLVAPLLGASGTTALGMLSLATSDVVAVREFGIGSAIGVMVDFAISIVFVPTLLGWIRPETAPPPQEAWFKKPMQRVATFSTSHARLVLTVGAILTVFSAVGVFLLRVDTNHINFFSAKHPLGESAAIIDTRLGGIYSFQILLEGPADSVRQPDALAKMEQLETELRTLPFVRKVTGLADYVKRIHRDLGGPGGATIPGDASLVAQELFVFSLADQGRIELERVAASDFSKAQITVKLASMSSDLVFEQIREAEQRAERIFSGSPVRPTVTGSGRLFSTLDHYLVVSQISSFATAFVTVFAVIFAIFRSWRYGILAIVPNLFPVLAIFGVMGWLNISLNVATIMLASVALGVVDDDTIHFISRYRREKAHGRSMLEAIELATTHEGRAALTTAIINSCSFAVLGLSEYRPTAWFGGLLALTMIVAFLAEVFILPATIVMAPRFFGGERARPPVRSPVT